MIIPSTAVAMHICETVILCCIIVTIRSFPVLTNPIGSQVSVQSFMVSCNVDIFRVAVIVTNEIQFTFIPARRRQAPLMVHVNITRIAARRNQANRNQTIRS